MKETSQAIFHKSASILAIVDNRSILERNLIKRYPILTFINFAMGKYYNLYEYSTVKFSELVSNGDLNKSKPLEKWLKAIKFR